MFCKNLHFDHDFLRRNLLLLNERRGKEVKVGDGRKARKKFLHKREALQDVLTATGVLPEANSPNCKRIFLRSFVTCQHSTYKVLCTRQKKLRAQGSIYLLKKERIISIYCIVVK
jgi:hypothetical protein